MQISKLLALIGAILSIFGSFFFTLYTYVNSVYGVGGILSLITAFGIATSWIDYMLIIVFLIFLLACVAQIFGIQSSISAIIGGAITVAFCIFIFLGLFGVLSGFTDGIGLLLDHVDWIPGVIPVNIFSLNPGLGTYIAAVGGILTLISGFLHRE